MSLWLTHPLCISMCAAWKSHSVYPRFSLVQLLHDDVRAMQFPATASNNAPASAAVATTNGDTPDYTATATPTSGTDSDDAPMLEANTISRVRVALSVLVCPC